MRRTTTIIALLLCTVCLHAQKTIAEVFVPEYNGNPAVTVTVTQETDSKYYIETVLDLDGTDYGKLCIGQDRASARKTLEITKRFLETPEMDFLLFHVDRTSGYLKLCRMEECDVPEDEEQESITPYITDGTDVYSEVPAELIRKALARI